MSKEKYFKEVNAYFQIKDREEIDKCYLCGEKVEFEQASTMYMFKAVECSSCGFTWSLKQPTQEVLDKFYETSNAMKQWSDLKMSEEEKARQEKKFFPIWSFMGEKQITSCLDVGCGNGFFLNHIQLGMDRCGIEMNGDAWKHCEFPVYDCYDNFKESIHGRKTFQMVTMFGVLEHLKNPVGEVNNYKKHMTGDGYLAVIVPNVDSLVVKTLGKECCTFCPQHLWYFNIDTLDKLMKKCGLARSLYFTIEPELQPILKKLKGFKPYDNIGVTLTDTDLNERSITFSNMAYKIVAFYHREKNTVMEEMRL